MLSKLKSLLIRNKYTALAITAILAATAVAVFLFNLSYQKSGLQQTTAPTATITPAASTPAPTDTGTSTPEPSASAEPTQAPGTNGSFTFTICPADVTLNPKLTAGSSSSGFTPSEEPTRQPLDHIRTISAGHVFDEAGYGSQFGSSYALGEDGTLYQWGMVNWDSKNRPSSFPQKVMGIDGAIKQIDGRFVLTEQGDVYLLFSDKAPQKIKELAGSAAIAQARESSVYTIDQAGNVLYYSQYGPYENKADFSRLTAMGKVKSIAANPFIMLAVTTDGKLLKKDPYSPEAKSVAIVLPSGERVAQMYPTMSYKHPAYLRMDSGHWFVVTGDQKLEQAIVPDNTIQVVEMELEALALKTDGTVWAWGEGGGFALVQGSMLAPENAKRVQGLSGVKALAAGQTHLLALTEDGRVLSAGSNMFGQLGQLSIFAEQPAVIGSWQGLDGLFPIYNELFAITRGDVWSLDANENVKPVLLGQKAKKAFTALGHFAILTESGKLIVADPDETQPCRILQAPSPIVDAASTNNGVVLALQDGRVYQAEGNMRMIEVKSEMRMDPKPAGKVTQVYGDPIPFVLTDKGELIFRQKTQDGVPILRPVITETPIKEWEPLHYVYFEGIGYVGKALGANNRVYDVNLLMKRDGGPETETATIEVVRTVQSGTALSGGAVVDANGHITEKLYSTAINTNLPAGAKLRAEASFYHIPIEGRSYFYHALAIEDGTIYWLGDRPFIGPTAPKPVLAP